MQIDILSSHNMTQIHMLMIPSALYITVFTTHLYALVHKKDWRLGRLPLRLVDSLVPDTYIILNAT